MAIATWASLDAKVAAPYEILYATKLLGLAEPTTKWSSMWLAAPNAGAAPTTAVVPTRATVGALGQQNGTGLRIVKTSIGSGVTGLLMLCDRLSHQGGLVGNVGTAQTTNLPTAALTRYTSGVGVMMGIEIYSTIGTTPTTVTTSYTDQDGNAAQISQTSPIGGTSFREPRRLLWLPLAADDYGVKSVESVTLLATTGTAGNIGVTLFKPLLMISMPSRAGRQPDPILGELGGGLPEIVTDACLFWLYLPAVAVILESVGISASLYLAED